MNEPQAFVDLQDTGDAQAQLVLQAIARHADWNTGSCFPSQDALAKMAKCSDRTVRKHLARLEQDGFIKRAERRGDNGARWSDTITLIGYADWIATLRSGGTVLPPKCIARGDDDNPPEDPSGCSEMGPEKDSGGPGTLSSGAPGTQASGYNEPSLISQLNTPPLPPAGGRGRKRSNELDDALRTVLSERPGDVKWVFAVERVLAPVVSQRRLDAPSIEAALRGLADWVSFKGLTTLEAEAVVTELLEKRKATVKPSDIEAAVKARLGVRPAAAVLVGDPALMARWPEVVTDLARNIGDDRTASWFSTIVIDRIDAGVARVATHKQFIAAYVERDYSAQLRASLDAVFGGVSSVVISTRRAAA